MKYKDYYKSLGVARSASEDEIKKAYRKLARQYHPDVSKDPAGEEKFKEVSEAYKTLKDPKTRAAYDNLGTQQSGQDFQPPPDWQKQYGETIHGFENVDFEDLFAGLTGQRHRAGHHAGARPIPGQDFEASTQITLEEAYRGTQVDINLVVQEYDEMGRIKRVPLSFKANIPKGATDGQRLRLRGKGGKGMNGGRDGDLYLKISLHPHPLFRSSDHELYIDLPITPWEAALGATVEVPTLAGAVKLKIPAGTSSGQKLRLAKRGLPKPHGGEGDLFAIVQIAVPAVISERERNLYKELAEASTYDPRIHYKGGRQ